MVLKILGLIFYFSFTFVISYATMVYGWGIEGKRLWFVALMTIVISPIYVVIGQKIQKEISSIF